MGKEWPGPVLDRKIFLLCRNMTQLKADYPLPYASFTYTLLCINEIRCLKCPGKCNIFCDSHRKHLNIILMQCDHTSSPPPPPPPIQLPLQVLCCFKLDASYMGGCLIVHIRSGNVTLLFASYASMELLTLMLLQSEQRKIKGKTDSAVSESVWEIHRLSLWGSAVTLSSSSSLSLTLISIWVSHILPILGPLWQQQLKRKRIWRGKTCVYSIFTYKATVEGEGVSKQVYLRGWWKWLVVAG